MPDLDDPDDQAKDHGNLMDVEVAEVERNAAEVAGGKDHRLPDDTAEPNGPSKRTEPPGVADEQATELLAEKYAEGQDSVT